MIVRCPKCHASYDDVNRSSICPHPMEAVQPVSSDRKFGAPPGERPEEGDDDTAADLQ